MKRKFSFVTILSVTLVLLFSSCRNYQGSDVSEQQHPDMVKAAERVQQQDLEGAMVLYQGLLQKDPEFASAHLRLGMVYQTRREPVSAVYHFRRYLEQRGEEGDTAQAVERMIQGELLRIIDSHPSVRAMQPADVLALQDEIDALQDRLDASENRVARLSLELEQARRRAGDASGGASGGDTARNGDTPALDRMERELADLRRENRRLRDAAGANGDKDPDAPAQDSATPGRTYTVRSGDNLSTISQRVYNTPHRWREIQDANPNVNPNRLRIGQTLVIP